MAVVGGMMVPHPPLIIPEIGRGQERKIAHTIDAYKEASRLVAEMKPETIVVFSPHALMYADYFHVSPGAKAKGDFSAFGEQRVMVDADYDSEMANEIVRFADNADFPMGVEGEKRRELDHGTMIPLYFINQCYSGYRVVRIGGAGLSLAEHYRAGQIVAQAARSLGRRIFLVGSGDLSHKLKEDGPYGFNPQGPEYDKRIMDVMGEGQFGKLLEFSETFCDQATECGHRSFTMMAGAMDGVAVNAARLSYEGPFGVGYGICTYRMDGSSAERFFLEEYEQRKQEECRSRRSGEDAYVALARNSLEYYVRSERMLRLGQVQDQLPKELLTVRAGVFVSVHMEGALRGCIGTISPVCESVAEEIIQNAVSAGAHDPRFPAIREAELPYLVYSVDVLGEAEPVSDTSELDVRRYGIIVSKDRRRGLLLPDLDGVDTVEEQLRIAKKKAGIREDEADVRLERFEVIRHGEKS